MSEAKTPTRNDIVITLLTEIRDELRRMNKRAEPAKPKPRNLPPPPNPADDPNVPQQPKRKLVFNDAIASWQWENDK